jgi:hypothetical protein
MWAGSLVRCPECRNCGHERVRVGVVRGHLCGLKDSVIRSIALAGSSLPTQPEKRDQRLSAAVGGLIAGTRLVCVGLFEPGFEPSAGCAPSGPSSLRES